MTHPETVRRLRSKAPPKALEAESCRHRDGTGSKSRSIPAEARGVNVVHDPGWVEVQIVEQVVGINAEFKLGVFAKHRYIRQPKGLAPRHIHVPVSLHVEGDAAYAVLSKNGYVFIAFLVSSASHYLIR